MDLGADCLRAPSALDVTTKPVVLPGFRPVPQEGLDARRAGRSGRWDCDTDSADIVALLAVFETKC